MANQRFDAVLASEGSGAYLEVPLDVPAVFLAAALAADPGGREAFDGFAFTHRREWVEWVTGAKRAETRERRVRGVVEQVRERAS
jgi:uncharacterized protein YdeI (YjbR/CyaY-like superfamily)